MKEKLIDSYAQELMEVFEQAYQQGNTSPDFTKKSSSLDLDKISYLASRVEAKRLENEFIEKSVEKRWEEATEHINAFNVYDALRITAKNCYCPERVIEEKPNTLLYRHSSTSISDEEKERIMKGLERFLAEYGDVPLLADPVMKMYNELKKELRVRKYGKLGKFVNKVESVLSSAMNYC